MHRVQCVSFQPFGRIFPKGHGRFEFEDLDSSDYDRSDTLTLELKPQRLVGAHRQDVDLGNPRFPSKKSEQK